MQIKIKSKNICLWCKKKIKVGDKVHVYKRGVITHDGECNDKIVSMAKKWKEKNGV